MEKTQILIIGGGAGGLELAIRLGKKLGRKKKANIILVDYNLFHIWKPLWHELAAGTLNIKESDFIFLAAKYYFKFMLGKFIGLDKKKKFVFLSEMANSKGEEILPARQISYDKLIIAVGSESNDFNIPGVKQFTYSLDIYDEALFFHQQFVNNLLKIQQKNVKELTLAVIGAGATGIELATELLFSCQQALKLRNTPFTNSSSKINIYLIEKDPRILFNYPPNISHLVSKELTKRKIIIKVSHSVSHITDREVIFSSGKSLKADLIIWAAGIRAPRFLTNLGLEYNKLNQIKVNTMLQTVSDSNIFAIGDCAACYQPHTQSHVPPRAQAAHQQAKLLSHSLVDYIFKDQPLKQFLYHDLGSLISISHSTAIGNIKSLSGNILLKGKIAKWAYELIYFKHQALLHGQIRTLILFLTGLLINKIHHRLKLH